MPADFNIAFCSFIGYVISGTYFNVITRISGSFYPLVANTQRKRVVISRVGVLCHPEIETCSIVGPLGITENIGSCNHRVITFPVAVLRNGDFSVIVFPLRFINGLAVAPAYVRVGKCLIKQAVIRNGSVFPLGKVFILVAAVAAVIAARRIINVFAASDDAQIFKCSDYGILFIRAMESKTYIKRPV